MRNENQCVECGLCLRTCPGAEYDYPKWNKALFGKGMEEIRPDFGWYLALKKGYATDSAIRENASSGGLATALACFLLEKKRVDYVIGVVGEGAECRVQVLRAREEVLSATQSKYVFCPVNTIIRYILEHRERCLYIGLPCQIQGLRKAAERIPALRERVALCAGVFCGLNLLPEATEFLIRKSGVAPSEIERIEYRGKRDGQTGFRIRSAQQDFFVSKHGYTILNAFYSRERCWKCYDLTAEFSDVSFGDAWEMGTGWSRIVIRTPQAAAIMEEMEREGVIFTQDSCENDFYISQKRLFAYKKRGIAVRQRRFRDFPEYGVTFPPLRGLAKWKAELFLLSVRFGKTPLARTVLQCLPIRFLENLSETLMGKDTSLVKILRYGVWGVVTSVFNFVCYWALLSLGMGYRSANLISMLLTKAEAYLTNKLFVFRSHCASKLELLYEILRFAAARLFSAVVEYAGLIFLVDFLNVDKLAGKAVMIVFITIINYLFGSLLVYRKKEPSA